MRELESYGRIYMRADGTRPDEGRPSLYTAELVVTICTRIALGESLRKITSDNDMPDMSTIFDWLAKYPEFTKQYAQAKEAQADTLTDDMEDIARDPKYDVQRARLIIDTRKWAASKLKPKKYGDKIDMTTNGKDIAPILVKFVGDDDSKDD